MDILRFEPWKILRKLRVLKEVRNDDVMSHRGVLKKMGLEFGPNVEI